MGKTHRKKIANITVSNTKLIGSTPLVFDNVKTRVLENGATLVFERLPFESSVLDISVRFGAANDPKEKQGAAHFLEHMLFSGTKNRKKQQIFKMLDLVGGECNAFTMKQATRYYVQLLSRDFPKAVDIMSDCFKNCQFYKEMAALERGVILSELGQSIDQPADFVFDMFLEQIFNEEFGRRTLGTVETIKGIERTDLLDVYKGKYCPQNLTIGVCGNLKEEEVKKQLEENFSWNEGKTKNEKQKRSTKPISKATEKVFQRKTEHAHIVCGFPIMTARNEDFLSFRIVNTILGGGLSSRLNDELREKRGLCYDVHSLLQGEEDYGFFAVYSSTKKENLPKLKSLIIKEMQKMKDGEISKKDLENAKKYIESRELLFRENIFKRTEENLQCWQYFKETPSEILNKTLSFSVDDVKQAAERYLLVDKLAVTVLQDK